MLAFCMTMGGTAPGQASQIDPVETPSKPPQRPIVRADRKQDVIVIAPEQNVQPLVPLKEASQQSTVSRVEASESHRFVRCAKHVDPKLVRQAIEAVPNRYDSAWALDRIIRAEQACYSGLSTIPPSPYYGECNPVFNYPYESLCRAFFDRGALIESALETHAPHLAFHDGDLTEPAVLQRFLARDALRNATRLPSERIPHAVVACAVARHPAEGLALIRSEPGSRSETRLRTILLGRSLPCLGGAKSVVTEAAQFRAYVADAVYFWAVALLDVDTLIPSNAVRR